jgi:cytochrome P450
MMTGQCYEYDCCSDNDHLTIMFTSESFVSWRRLRRAAHEALTKRALRNYHPIQTKEATILVSSLLTPSANLKQDGHFKRLAASSIMTIVYDYPTIKSEHDHAVEKIEKYNDRLSQALTTGSYLVDIFPWMKHIPERSWLSFSRVVPL